MSSEDYQNELNSDTVEDIKKVKLEDFNVPDEENGTSFDEKINSEIPVDVDTMGVVIDSAPSLSTDGISEEPEEISENDINDLMAELMSSMEPIMPNRPEIGIDEETIEAGKALEEYLNSPVEQLISHPEVPSSLGFEIPDIDSMEANQFESETSSDFMEFPSMPQMPDIPEVVERTYEDPAVSVEEPIGFSGVNLDPITIDNFDERFVDNTSDELSTSEIDDFISVSEDSFTDSLTTSVPDFEDINQNAMPLDEIASTTDSTNGNISLSDMSLGDDSDIDFSELDALLADDPIIEEVPVDVPTPEAVVDEQFAAEGIAIDELSGEESALEETVVEEIAIDETPDVEPAIEETKAEEAATDEMSTEQPVIDEAVAEEIAIDELPVEESNLEANPEATVEEESVYEEESEEGSAEVPTEESVEDHIENTVEEAEPEAVMGDEAPVETSATAVSSDGFSESELEDMRKELAEIDDEDDSALEENDIEKLINQAQNSAEHNATDNREDMTLEELLQASNDGKADDIGELLDKAERNEAVDEGISELLNGSDLPPINIDDSEEVLDPKAAKKAEKLRLKEEKKEAKRKAKEAKKAEKIAKKNAKLGIEPLQKLSFDTPGTEDENNAPSIPSVEEIAASGIEHNTDMSDIEALLSDNVSDDANSHNQDSLGDVFGQSEDIFGQNIDDTSASIEVESADGDSIDSIPEKGAKSDKNNPIKAFFGKIVNFLTEEDEEDAEKSEIILSDENAAILDELNKEESKGKKKKKGKKGKKQSTGDEENAEDLPEKKPPKKKKEKKPKKASGDTKPEPKISKKKISMVALVCIMLAVVILLITYFTADYTVKKSGRDAFENEDYQTCYQNFYGKKLSESEQVMYNRSECILKIQIWLREYEVYVEEGSEAKALDSLIQSVNSYPDLKATSEEWGCLDKVETVYDSMTEILINKYGISEEDALEIAAIEDDIVYTRVVNAIINGVTYEDALNYIYTNDISGTTPIEEEQEVPSANMDDKLPEEDGMSGDSFIEP